MSNNGPTPKKGIPLSSPLQRKSSLPLQITPNQPLTGFFDIPQAIDDNDEELTTQSHSAPGTMIFRRGASNSSSKASSNSNSATNSARTSFSNSSRTSFSHKVPENVPPGTEACWFTLPKNKNAEPPPEIDPQLIELVAKFKLELGLQLHILVSGSTTSQPTLATFQEQSASTTKAPLTRRFSIHKNISKRDVLQTILTKIDVSLIKFTTEVNNNDFAKELQSILKEGLESLEKRREMQSKVTNDLKTLVKVFIDDLETYLTASAKYGSTNSNPF